MRYTRIYADAAGRTEFKEIDIDQCPADFVPPSPPIDLSAPLEADSIMFATIPVGWRGELHSTPWRQFFLQFTGVVEVEVSGGRTVRTGPGDITLVEDTNGSGHITRVIGDVPVTGAIVKLPD
jgi:hypothetical protein